MSDRLSYWLILTAFVVTAVGFFLFGRKSAQNTPILPVKPKVDTLIVHDTITALKPVYIARRVTDTLCVPVRDTIRESDTLFVHLKREQLEWRDSLCTVWASGIQPAIDSVHHYTATTIITKEIAVPVKVRPRWAVGITGGYGAGKDGLTPYFGVGITYIVKSW